MKYSPKIVFFQILKMTFQNYCTEILFGSCFGSEAQPSYTTTEWWQWHHSVLCTQSQWQFQKIENYASYAMKTNNSNNQHDTTMSILAFYIGIIPTDNIIIMQSSINTLRDQFNIINRQRVRKGRTKKWGNKLHSKLYTQLNWLCRGRGILLTTSHSYYKK